METLPFTNLFKDQTREREVAQEVDRGRDQEEDMETYKLVNRGSWVELMDRELTLQINQVEVIKLIQERKQG